MQIDTSFAKFGTKYTQNQYFQFWVTLIMLVFAVYEGFERLTVDQPFIASWMVRNSNHESFKNHEFMTCNPCNNEILDFRVIGN